MLVLIIKPVSLTIPPTLWADMDSCIVLRAERPILRPDATVSATAMVTTPIPPICIRVIITIFPKRVQVVAVSPTMSPVTQDAEVAVKRQSTKLALPGAIVANGNISNSVPVKMRPPKPKIIICADDRCLFFIFNLNYLRNGKKIFFTAILSHN